jgi:hypothetical protein
VRHRAATIGVGAVTYADPATAGSLVRATDFAEIRLGVK